MDLSLMSTHHTGRWIVFKNGVIDSSILQKFFDLCQNVYHAAEKNYKS